MNHSIEDRESERGKKVDQSNVFPCSIVIKLAHDNSAGKDRMRVNTSQYV